jgi:arrestin-related trafficking adapter 4/5/7
VCRISFSNLPTTYLVCNHEWSFLEGEKKHSHTLKAGRHLFPFQLRLGGSLPSTLYVSAYGGASLVYKLRAVATRPGFGHNLQTQKHITLLRAFSTEAFEYQRLLEIENTWPEKVMYSIMVPHKAWAAGDTLTAVVKFSPLTKGVRVLSVVTTLNETTKFCARAGFQETTKHIVTTRHEFRHGQAVCVEPQDDCPRSSSSHQSGTRSTSNLPSPDISTSAYSTDTSSGNAMCLLPTNSNSVYSGEPSTSHNHQGGSSASPQQAQSGDELHSVPVDFELSAEEIATKIEILIPVSATPTHSLEPIVVSHRIRWTILIGNPDGHTSELRCSLPLHILDYRFIDEARSATAATRRLLLGGPEVPEEHDPDMELPSYPSHIRDRIANMYLPAQSALRVRNPWLYHGISPVQPDLDQDGRRSSGPPSGTHTPLEALYVSPPPGNDYADLEYVNSELTLSLSQNVPSPIEIHGEMMVSPPETTPSSRSASRRGSRASSPEQRDRGESSRSHSRRSSGPGTDLALSTYLHSNSAASRNLHSLDHVTMKPLTSLSASFALPTRHHVQAPPPPASPRSVHQPQHQHQQPQQLLQQQFQLQQQQQFHLSSTTAGTVGIQQQQATVPRTVPVTSHTLLHRAFTEVPDYDIASRGFLGGVTPLETLQGLPSYEEAEMQRSHSESDLVSMTRRLGRRASTASSHTSMPILFRPGLSMTASTTTTTTTTTDSS